MPFKLKPTYIYEHVREINLDEMKKRGVKAFLFDLDNTIMPPKTGFFPQEIKEWLERVKQDFKIAVVSNNHNLKYLEEVKKEVLSSFGITPEQAVMVGDRPLTDIWVGHRLNMITVLVDPLMKHQEHNIIKFLRKLERAFIRIN